MNEKILIAFGSSLKICTKRRKLKLDPTAVKELVMVISTRNSCITHHNRTNNKKEKVCHFDATIHSEN